MNRKNILILDPEQDMSALFARALEARKDCKCYWASREEEAVALSRDIPVDLALLDASMAMNGSFSILKRLKALQPDMVIVVDAYLHQKPLACKAIEHGAAGWIIKPVKIDEFRKKIESFLTPPTSPAA
ncbi:MAG: response regulator [Syntrophobacteraceae bacterium]|jgi:DNA-binding response OmpR family regulator